MFLGILLQMGSAQAYDVEPSDLSVTVARSEYVFMGRVIDITPAPPRQRAARPDDLPLTAIHVEVESQLKGETGSVFMMIIPGGLMDDGTRIVIPGVPKVRFDDRIIMAGRQMHGLGDGVFAPTDWNLSILVEDRVWGAAPIARTGRGTPVGSAGPSHEAMLEEPALDEVLQAGTSVGRSTTDVSTWGDVVSSIERFVDGEDR